MFCNGFIFIFAFMLIVDNTYSAKKFSPLVYDEKVIKHYSKLKPGTLAYDDFWDEIDYYCINGYKPSGSAYHKITGEHFFYLNINKIYMLHDGEKKKRPGSPYYRDLDYRLFSEYEQAKKNGYGLIIGKPRQVGLSWWGSSIMYYELIFNKGAQAGICAGKQDKADGFYNKILYNHENIREEYKVAKHHKNDKEFVLGYDDVENKQTFIGGLNSKMLIRTMFADAGGFEGENMSLVIFEEAGLFSNLILSYKSTEPCFRLGAIQFGVPLIWGTGGEIEKGSAGYMEMWENHHSYNLNKIFIPADEYYPGDGMVDEKTGNKAPSFFDLNTGKTDRVRARNYILSQREKAKKTSKEAFTKHIQSYPLEESEIFIKTSGGILDRIKLNEQVITIKEIGTPYDVKTGRLEWIDDEITTLLLQKAKDTKEACKIRIERGSKVKWVDDENGSISKILDPINNDNMEHKPDIAGCDSYDEEVEENTGSHGATIVYRTYYGPGKEYNLPIALLHERGDSSNDDVFYENNVKLAIYYNYKLLFEYTKIAIEKYFKDVGAEKYLKERPDLRNEIANSKARNQYGQRMNNKEHKNLATKLLKKEVRDNYRNIWFLKILNDLIDYGDKNTDIAMAYAMVLIYKLDIFEEMIDEDDYEYYDSDNVFDAMAYYDIDASGNVIVKTYGGDEYDEIPQFNPDLHLTELERMDYKKEIKKKKEEFEEIRTNFEKSRLKQFENLIKEELILRKN